MSRLWASAGLISLILGCTTAANASFELVSRGQSEFITEPSKDLSSLSVSASGRFTAFSSSANNLVSSDANGILSDVFVYDRDTNTTELITAGGNLDSVDPTISADGRFVAFDSRASNLIAGEDDGGLTSDVFLYDRDTGTTLAITTGGNDDSRRATISANGRFVAFESRASNLVAGDTNGVFDIFVYDVDNDTIELLAPGGGAANFAISPPSISADGRFVAFTSDASNLASGDTNGQLIDVFVFDRDTDTIELITAGGNSDSGRPSISADGRVVAFDSRASNLVASDSNGGTDDVFIYDRDTNTTELITAGGDAGSRFPLVSNDGRFVAFVSGADNLVPGVTTFGIFVHDRDSGTFESLGPDAIFNPATNNLAPPLELDIAFEVVGGDSVSSAPSVSATGQFVAFQSFASNLVAGDTNGVTDIFVRDRNTQLTENLTLGANGLSTNPSISADGSIVAFESEASNIAGVTQLFRSDIFVHDRNTGTTELVTAGANNLSGSPALSADGRFVAFHSFASNLVSADSNGSSPDIFVYDRQTGTTEIITNGGNTPFQLTAIGLSISADGQVVAFQSTASNLVAGDSNGDEFDIYVHDRATGSTELVTAGGDDESIAPTISADGRYVAFTSRATNLAPGGNAADLGNLGLFIYDRTTATTELLVVGGLDVSSSPSISADGQFVAFTFSSLRLLSLHNPASIVVYDRNTNATEKLTAGADAASVLPSISADGLTIAFSSFATNLTSDGILSSVVDVEDGTSFNTNIFVSTDNSTATADALAVTTNEDTAVSVTLTGSDQDGDALSFQTLSLPSNGDLSGTAPNLTYTPKADFFGSDSFTFAANDGSGPGIPATVTINVAPVNDAPVALGTDAGLTAVVTAEDTALAFTLAGSDPEGDPLTFSVTSAPNNGVLSGSAPNLTYSPNVNFNGPDQFSFTVSDGALNSAPVVINITVSSTNDGPTGNTQSLATSENTAVSITLTGTDPDTTALIFSIASFPANGTLTGDLPNLIYAPNNNFSGVDSFTFTVSDGTSISAPASVSVTVTEVIEPPPSNTAPVANSQSVSTPQGTAVAIALSGSDADGDSLSFAVVGQPANGSLTGSPPDLVYTPDAAFSGFDSLSFTVSDAEDVSSTAIVSISVVEAAAANVALFSAVLPTSRSVEVGVTATAFATLINAGTSTAVGCSVRLPGTVPANFFYQASDATSNQVIGQPNVEVDIPAGASQSFVFGITPTEEISAVQVPLEFQCANATDAASITGLNTLLLSASFTPVPDLIALVATTSNNGVMELANNSGFFSAATVNVGAAATITVSADTGGLALPLTLSLCQTDPLTSECINPTIPATDPVIVDIARGETPTFAVFATADGPIELDPANNRVFLFFNDDLGVVRGATSVAVENN